MGMGVAKARLDKLNARHARRRAVHDGQAAVKLAEEEVVLVPVAEPPKPEEPAKPPGSPLKRPPPGCGER